MDALINRVYKVYLQLSNLELNIRNKTINYGLYEGSIIKDIAMISLDYGNPVLLATNYENDECRINLLKKLKEYLPSKINTHINKKTLEHVFGENSIENKEVFVNGALTNFDVSNIKNEEVQNLREDRLNDIKEFLSVSYPEA